MDVNSLQRAIDQSTLTRLLANVFLFAVLVAALAVAVLELVNQQNLNPVISTILGTGLGIAAHAAGINQGSVLSPIGTTTTVTEAKLDEHSITAH